MKMERTKNFVRSTFYGVINTLVMMLLPFVIRTVMLYILGEEYIGLNSLFTSIFSVLNFAELGFGGAIVYYMYKPIASGDEDTICSLLNLFRKFYYIVGAAMLLLGIAIMPFMEHLIHGAWPRDINIYVLYLVFLFNAVFGYFFWGYKACLLAAHQRNDVSSKISLFVYVGIYLVQAAVLILFKNYYIYVILTPVCTILINVITAVAVRKMYPRYFCRGKVSADIRSGMKQKLLGLICYRLGGTALVSVDNIVISSFLGLLILGKFNNYYYILFAVGSMLTIFHNSLTAGVGNSLETESLQKNYQDYKMLIFINHWLCGWCAICLLCLYQSFMWLWVGQDRLFGMDTVILCVLYFYISYVRKIVTVYRDAAGVWYEDRFRPLVTVILNLILDVVLVNIFGINGILFSTIFISLFISYPWELKVFYNIVLKRNSMEYYWDLLKQLLITVTAALCTYLLCQLISTPGSVVSFLGQAGICLIIPNLLYVIVFRNRPEFGRVTAIMKRKPWKRQKEEEEYEH